MGPLEKFLYYNLLNITYSYQQVLSKNEVFVKHNYLNLLQQFFLNHQTIKLECFLRQTVLKLFHLISVFKSKYLMLRKLDVLSFTETFYHDAENLETFYLEFKI